MLSRAGIARCVFGGLLLAPASAFAQPENPIGPFAVDLRGIFARHKQEPSVATELAVPAANLPTRSLGISAGAQWYPWHVGIVTLGVGGHLLNGRGSRTVDPVTTPGTSGAGATTSVGSTVVRHFRVLTPDVSLNFGHRNGWSYISGGLGRSNLFVERKDEPVTNAPGRRTIHYGAGAKWFTNHHLAVSLDVRWYAVAPQTASATGAVAQPRTTLLVLSGGIAVR
jgi:hypothetical protein